MTEKLDQFIAYLKHERYSLPGTIISYKSDLLICSLNLDPKRMLVIFDIISIREGDKNEEKTIHGVSDRLCFTAS